jgi:hypothetical protein
MTLWHGIFTSRQALEYCGSKVRTGPYARAKRNRVDEAGGLLETSTRPKVTRVLDRR